MKRPIGIVIPHFRAPEKLKKCLAAIESQSCQPVEVFVRDNSDDNILFTAAVNEGLRKFCHGGGFDHVLVLNQDAYLQPATLGHLVDLMDASPTCGIACPIQLAEGSDRVTWGGSYDAFPFGKHRCDPLASYTTDFDTFWANGAAMLLRTSMVREIGLLDPNLRFICSDADYSFTARSRGWTVTVCARSRVFHALDSSGAAGSDALDQVKMQDAVYFAKKWLTGDLYKRLSFEGAGLTRLRLKTDIEGLEREIARLG